MLLKGDSPSAHSFQYDLQGQARKGSLPAREVALASSAGTVILAWRRNVSACFELHTASRTSRTTWRFRESIPVKMNQKLRIFQGVTGQAGQPGAIASGLRELGYEASAGSIEEHKFGYKADLHISVPSRHSAGIFKAVKPLADQFDVFHFHARSFSSIWPDQGFPSLLDLLMLKAEGKKVFFHFRGSEIRLAEVFRTKNPFHYVDDPVAAKLFTRMPDDAKLRSLKFIRSVCDGVFVTDPELQTYVPEAKIVPRVLNKRDWPFVGVQQKRVPIVVHAPSRRAVKGTEALVEAVHRLRARGVPIDFRLVENLPHEQAAEIYKEADIVVDQLRIGWYGVLATEAMALGKPVIAYIRDDIWQSSNGGLPIINANPITIESVLAASIGDWDLLQERSRASRSYFLDVHSSNRVCAQLGAIYESTESKQIDWVAVGEYLDSQKLAGPGKASRAWGHAQHIHRILRYINVENMGRIAKTTRKRGLGAAFRLVANKVMLR